MKQDFLTAEALRGLLSYDPKSGDFYWLVKPSARVEKGSKAGTADPRPTKNYPYWRIKINRRVYLAHRLAWLYVYGEWPNGQIDHIDGNGLNNAIANLRDVSQSENQRNRAATCANKSGFKGVSLHRNTKKYQAQIKVEGRQIYLGLFDTPEDAYQAYLSASEQLHGEFRRAA